MNSVLSVRFGGLCGILGCFIFVAGTLTHPMQADPNDDLAAFTEYAADSSWVASHLAQFCGFLLIVLALLALDRLMRPDRARSFSSFGSSVAVASLAVFTVLQAVDGVALKMTVDQWAKAPESEKLDLFAAAIAIRRIEMGVAALWSLVTGVAVVLFGLATTLSDNLPRWSGYAVVMAGALSCVGGVVMAHEGFSATAMNVHLSALLVIAWVAYMSVLMLRRS